RQNAGGTSTQRQGHQNQRRADRVVRPVAHQRTSKSKTTHPSLPWQRRGKRTTAEEKPALSPGRPNHDRSVPDPKEKGEKSRRALNRRPPPHPHSRRIRTPDPVD